MQYQNLVSIVEFLPTISLNPRLTSNIPNTKRVYTQNQKKKKNNVSPLPP